jgi:predicted nucleic acid-binding protein
MLYADTSALLPYYRAEATSAAVESLLLAQSKPVLISDLTRVEFASALARWVRMAEITEAQANRVESAFYEDVSEGRFRVTGLTRAQYERAMHWLLMRRTGLRTLDALHLACAEAGEAHLLTLDEDLRAAAEFLGVATHALEL